MGVKYQTNIRSCIAEVSKPFVSLIVFEKVKSERKKLQRCCLDVGFEATLAATIPTV
jgi:hypothetical protein